MEQETHVTIVTFLELCCFFVVFLFDVGVVKESKEQNIEQLKEVLLHLSDSSVFLAWQQSILAQSPPF